MAGTAKSNSERAGAPGAETASEPFGDVVRKGIESLVDVQKQALDMAGGQTAIALAAIEHSGTSLVSGLTSAVEWGFQAVAATEKSLLDLAATQNALALSAAAPLITRIVR